MIGQLEEEELALREKFVKIEEERKLLKRELSHLESEESKVQEIDQRYTYSISTHPFQILASIQRVSE